MGVIKRVIIGIAALVGVTTIVVMPASARTLPAIDDADTVVLHGNVHPLARPEFDVGPTETSLPMERMILTMRLSPNKQAELDRLLVEQQNPTSPNFHRWLTPEEFGERFGPDADDIAAITHWLASHGFAVEEVAKGRTWINFSGTVSDVEHAFHTKIHDYSVNGRLHNANDRNPALPRALAGLVAGVVSLHNFPLKPMNTGPRPLAPADYQPEYTYFNGSHYLAPGDFAIIYNVNALYDAGINGTGQSIAIVGRTHPSSDNWANFRNIMGLSINPPQVIVNGPDPGDLGLNEDIEADLDVEWAGAVAKNATIKFVVSKSTAATDGVDLSAQYIVNNDLAPVMSTSFGLCEASLGSAGNSFYNNLWMQAAAQGITSFVASGDSGAAGCSDPNGTSGSGLAVNGLASTPYNVAVGGTQFNEGSGDYWNTTNGSFYTSALSYIPEVAWNESGNVAGGSGLWATGGGASSIYGKPSWQVSPGVPADGKRDIPDVSLSGAGHDAYLVVSQGNLFAVGGTSASAPSLAGLMALIVQKTGHRQGNANTRFYQLGSAQYGSGGAAVFHDASSGNNSVPGVTGFSCTSGYDLPTGLGSVDAYALVNFWTGAVHNDFFGDGNRDFVIWRPSEGTWYILNGATNAQRIVRYGTNGDIPVSGDYDGIGRMETAVWRPSDGTWYILNSATNTQRVVSYGTDGDIPVPGDYDGIGRTQTAVWRPSDGTWYILNSATDTQRVVNYGTDGDIPVPGDYDSDGKTDLAVWRPSEGTWYILNSATGTQRVVNYGTAGDIPVPGDYDGDGKTDLAVWRASSGTWFILNSAIGTQRVVNYGTDGDIPVPGDYDGDSKTDLAVWRPSNGTWFILNSATNTQNVTQWGTLTDQPLK